MHLKRYFPFALSCMMLASKALFASESYCNPVLNQWIHQIRDPQTEAAAFRHSLEKIGEYLALQVANKLEVESRSVQTLTGGIASSDLPKEMPVLVTVLRAGLPLHHGVLNVFPEAHTGFIAMARNEKTLIADLGYVALPDMKGKLVILVDTMIATGGSILDSIEILKKRGAKQIIVLGAIASSPGIKRIQEAHPDVEFVVAVTDPTLNEKGYIVPGLGDAGDRSYGSKFEVSP